MARASRTGIKGLYKDSNGRYRIDHRWTDTKGADKRFKELLPVGTSNEAARRRGKAVLEMILRGEDPNVEENAHGGLSSAFNEYLKLVGVGSNPKYKPRHRDHLVSVLGDIALTELSEIAIERYKRARRDKGAGPATVNRELQTLKAFLNKCVEWGWLEARPKIKLFKEPPARVRWLTDDERAKLDAKLPARFKRVVLVAALSGQRLSNVIGLKRSQVDLEHRTLSFPKTKTGRRHDVPISDALAVVLEEALKDSEGYEYVLLSRFKENRRPYTSSGVTGFFRKLAEKAGVKDLHFHDLRHDFATRVRRAGHGLDVVQQLLGHTTPAMTMRYAHLGKAELQAAVNAIAPASVAPALPPDVHGKSQSSIKTAAK